METPKSTKTHHKAPSDQRQPPAAYGSPWKHRYRCVAQEDPSQSFRRLTSFGFEVCGVCYTHKPTAQYILSCGNSPMATLSMFQTTSWLHPPARMAVNRDQQLGRNGLQSKANGLLKTPRLLDLKMSSNFRGSPP